jgi:hypothetical protein
MIQSRDLKPSSALVMETREVLTMVVSRVDKKRLIHILIKYASVLRCRIYLVDGLTRRLKHEASSLQGTWVPIEVPRQDLFL